MLREDQQMSGRTAYFAVFSLLLSVTLMCCAKKQEMSETQLPSPGVNAKPIDTTTAGSISGTVHLDGAAPKLKSLNMAAEPACAKQHSTPAMTQEALVGKDGALENVVVYLKGDFGQYKFAPPPTPVTITQKGCMYEPHVLALETRQSLQVVNDDPVTHNIHPLPMDNREWNESQPPGAAPIDQEFAHEEVAIPVKCNIHPWMKAYIAVFNHPYFQVTGTDGSFNLKNVPPGTYTLVAWHELYGTQQQSVSIGPKEEKTIPITFQAAGGTH
jgi:Polysaccharide lyase family 4, domain II